MPTDPNKISQFWQELKRRKVTRTITVYAAAAFVILELTDIVAPSLGLPSWTLNLIIFLLCVGFIIAVILSWIYDIHPQEGIVKTELAHKVKGEDVPQSSNSWKIASYISFVVIVTLIVLNIIPRINRSIEISGLDKSIAVLPFEDMSPKNDQEYFCDGMTEEIINALSQIEGLKVIARTSAFAFKGKHEDMREIGKKLNVETLLEGSIRKDENRLRITAQLINASDGSHLWSDTYDRNLEGVFDIQDEISLAIAENLEFKLLGEKVKMMVKRPTENLEAYNLYLQGMYYHNKLTPDGLQIALDCYEQALQKDPKFAMAYVALATLYYHLSFSVIQPIESIPRAIEYANKALEIDNTIAEAYVRRGDISMHYEWDWEAAERYFKQALHINPNLAETYANYSELLTFTGHNEAAITNALRAQELDPLSNWSNVTVANAYSRDHQFDRAIEEFKIVLAMYPDDLMGLTFLGFTYRAKLMYKEAIEVVKEAVELTDGVVGTAFLAILYYEFGEKVKANELFDLIKQRPRDKYVPPSTLYVLYRVWGEEDLAYEWFERAVNQRDSFLLWVINDPIEKNCIPDEPRYNSLLKKVGMEKYH